MLEIVLVTALTGLLTVLLHHEGLLWISASAASLGANRPRIAMAGIVTAILMLHLFEIGLYSGSLYIASSLLHLGRLVGDVQGTDLEVLYFSAETYTSLGLGDIVPTGPMRLLASVEPLNGLLMLGWSATFIHVEVDRFWRQPLPRPSGEQIWPGPGEEKTAAEALAIARCADRGPSARAAGHGCRHARR